MTAPHSTSSFRNPLHGKNFADPFVLKFNGRYYAYGTPGQGGLPVLKSTNLVTWEEAGVVLEGPEPSLAHWAPEVAYDNGQFFLYYSTGGQEGEGHRLRVAIGSDPTGSFDELPDLLDPEDPFTIDAHPFRDDDGQWYLFYCRDFLDGDLVGTGIVVDRLIGMTELAGERTTVLRPHAEWHLYQRQRKWYDRTWDWYTVEGPFVTKHDGRYWCFYSGGAWKAENYGISSAVADHPLGPYEAVQAEDTADVLRTVPGKVIGPGHGSQAVAPDNLTEYLVYHAWDVEHTGRFLHADRLLWDHGRPQSPGPCTEPQPLPPDPLFRDFFDFGSSPRRHAREWSLHGAWEVASDGLGHPGGEEHASAVLTVPAPPSHLFEVNLAVTSPAARGGGSGVMSAAAEDEVRTLLLVDSERRELRWRLVRGGRQEAERTLTRLPSDYRADAYHQLVVRKEQDVATVTLDGMHVGSLPQGLWTGERLGLFTTHDAIRAEGVTLTSLCSSTTTLGR